MTKIHSVTANTLNQWLDAGEAVLVDVREPAEHAAENIAQARNLPLSQVNCDAAHLPEHQGKKVVLHCLSGKRSSMACEKLAAEGSESDVWNLEGGIKAWKESQLPTVTAQNAVLPLDQQVQIAVGVLLILSILGGYLLSTDIFLAAGMIGLGLVSAGITGRCGMLYIMAKMPWNQKGKSQQIQ